MLTYFKSYQCDLACEISALCVNENFKLIPCVLNEVKAIRIKQVPHWIKHCSLAIPYVKHVAHAGIPEPGRALSPPSGLRAQSVRASWSPRRQPLTLAHAQWTRKRTICIANCFERTYLWCAQLCKFVIPVFICKYQQLSTQY